MDAVADRLARYGVAVPQLLLPAEGVDLERWATIACDQYTQDRSYWDAADAFVGAAPSTLRMVFPEVYLEDRDRSGRIAAIRATMASYLRKGIFRAPLAAPLYIERRTPYHPLRRGLVLAIDLERYDWRPSARPLVRATEGTVEARIPPRMDIRRGAPLESPHIMLLVDDDRRELLEGLEAMAKRQAPRYDTSLMKGSGGVSGWAVEGEEALRFLADQLEGLASRAGARYGTEDEAAPFLFAVGDGNHSLATAKAVWDEFKNARAGDPALASHPARWALVEVENLYDAGLQFEPIHRLVFGASLPELRAVLESLPGAAIERVADAGAMSAAVDSTRPGSGVGYGLASGNDYLVVRTPYEGIATEPLQPILDAFVAAGRGRSMDYVHGEAEVLKAAVSGKAAAILLPPVDKGSLFATVARSGPLPRKSFSMGEACEKRFYLECRRLFD